MPLTRLMKSLLLVPLAAFSLEQAAGRNYVGINPWFLNDWDGSNAFADIFVHAREWSAAAWGSKVAVDSLGWPTADASTVIFGAGTPAGRYHLRFTGQATSVELMWAKGSVDSLAWDAATNISTASVNLKDSSTTAGLVLTGTKRTASSASGTGFTNLHLWRPGYADDSTRMFTDAWESLIKRFDVVRFMDWGSTNSNPLVSWSDRRSPRHANRGTVVVGSDSGELGLPVEYMVQLCNRTGTDAWINVPPDADSTYVSNLVKTVLYGSDGANPYSGAVASPAWKPLDPDLKLYLEFGNELWNSAGGFNCFYWLHDQSEVLRAGSRTEPIFFDGQSEEWTTLFRWMGWRAAQTSLWSRAAAGDAAMMTRVRPVLEGQIGYHAMAGEALHFLEDWYGVPRGSRTATYRIKDLFWGSGSAPYVNLEGASADAVFSAYPDTAIPKAVTSDALLAGAYGLHRVAYEGGPSTQDLSTTLAAQVLSDTRTKDLIENHHRMWTRRGGELAVYYDAVGDNSWSFAHTWTDTLSPKLQGIDALRGDSAWSSTLGCIAPCRERVDTSVSEEQGTFWWGDSARYGVDSGEWLAYPVSIPAAGTWKLVVNATSDNAGDSLEVVWSDSLVATLTTSKAGTFQNLAAVELPFDKGLQVVRLRGRTGRLAVRSLDWTLVAASSVRHADASSWQLRVRGPRGGVLSFTPGFEPKALEVRSLDGRLLERQDLAAGATTAQLGRDCGGLRLVRVLGSNGRSTTANLLVR